MTHEQTKMKHKMSMEYFQFVNWKKADMMRLLLPLLMMNSKKWVLRKLKA